MRPIATERFLGDLIVELDRMGEEVKAQFDVLSPAQLTWKPNPDRWSVAECFEHLNLSFDYYLPQFEAALSHPSQVTEMKFRPGPMAAILIAMLEPRSDDIIRFKARTLTAFEPKDNDSDATAVARFLTELVRFRDLIERSKDFDIGRIRVRSAVRWLRIKIADAYRLVYVHMRRHILQAEYVVEEATFPL